MVVVGEPVAGGNLKGKRQRPFVNCTDLMKLIPSWVNAGPFPFPRLSDERSGANQAA